jgi:hypothetical protein
LLPGAADLAGKQCSGTVPASLAGLEFLGLRGTDGNQPSDVSEPLDLGYNRLDSSGVPSLLAFLSLHDPDWDETQTVPVTQIEVGLPISGGLDLSWIPISYTQDGGYYEISLADDLAGPYTVKGLTASKAVNSFWLSDLQANTQQYLHLRSYTPPHREQVNALWSEYSTAIAVLRSSRAVRSSTIQVFRGRHQVAFPPMPPPTMLLHSPR